MLEEREETRYDVRAFAQAYVDAHPDGEHGLMPAHTSYNAATHNAAMKVRYQQVLAGLQDLFGLSLDPEDPALGDGVRNVALFDLFKQTAKAYHHIVPKYSRPAEGGLLLTGQLREAGYADEVFADQARIEQLNQEAADLHLDIMARLLGTLLDERSAKVFTSADLRAIGIDDTPPNPDAQPGDWDDY